VLLKLIFIANYFGEVKSRFMPDFIGFSFVGDCFICPEIFFQ